MGLGRHARFAGQTPEWYPVLAHVLTVAKFLPDEFAIHGLLHDAAESCIGDIPSTLKLKEVTDFEAVLLRRIYDGHNVALPTPEAAAAVKQVDQEALAAEAHVLGHPAAEKYWPTYSEEVADLTRHHLESCHMMLYPNIAGPIFTEAFNHYVKVSKAEVAVGGD